MSIAVSLQRSVDRARELHDRANGDLGVCLGTILADIEADIERVRGLETEVPINTDLLKEYQRTGGLYDYSRA